MAGAAPHIGTLRERPLHSSLKQWYAEPGDEFEVPLDRFVIDIVRDNLLIEIQTRSFSSMKRKLAVLLGEGYRIRIVHPIPQTSWIVKLDKDDREVSRRKSPKHLAFLDGFSELVSFPELLDDPNLEVELLLITQEEMRRHHEGKAWRRKGWVVEERRLVDVVGSRLLASSRDALQLLPDGLPEAFGTADVAAAAPCSRRVAQQALYCLRNAGAVDIVGKAGNALQYRVADLDG